MPLDVTSATCVALDFETSAYRGACACALGMARLENNEVVDTYYHLVRPPSSRVYFKDVHGLTWADLKNQPTFVEIWPDVAAFISGAKWLVAHNARFDMNVLAACCEKYGLPMPAQPFLCTLRGSRKALRLHSYSLSSVAAFFRIDLRHHHAGSDALACAMIHARLRAAGLADEEMRLPPPKTRGTR